MEMDRQLMEAAWRYQIVAPLLDPTLPPGEKVKIRRELLERPVFHHEAGEVKLSARTIRRWCRAYRQKGMEGLLPACRKDAGSLKALPEEILTKALAILEDDPGRSLPLVITMLEGEDAEIKDKVKHSTLWRHLKQRGFIRIPTTSHTGPFRRFEAEVPNEMWQGDVLYGPPAIFSGQSRSTRFILWLDDHSRFVVHIEAYPDERLPSLEDSLKKAILKNGLPHRIFCDNALTYSSRTFLLICSDLGIAKIHSTPGYPPSRGKVERFFRTLRAQFIREVEKMEPLPAEQLNRYLSAWVDAYHRRLHSETKKTPEERYQALSIPRILSPERLHEAFLQWEKRDIGSTAEVKFEGNRYYVDPSLANCKNVVIRYDPFDLTTIYIWAHGRKIATATTHQLISRRRLRKDKPPDPRNVSGTAKRYLQSLEEAHQGRLAQEMNLIRYQDDKEKKEV